MPEDIGSAAEMEPPGERDATSSLCLKIPKNQKKAHFPIPPPILSSVGTPPKGPFEPFHSTTNSVPGSRFFRTQLCDRYPGRRR